MFSSAVVAIMRMNIGMQGTPMTGELKDVLAGRTEDEEAMCAVCSGGLSIAPNLIVFCERCDIAVHQQCYGVDDIPAGELMMGWWCLSCSDSCC